MAKKKDKSSLKQQKKAKSEAKSLKAEKKKNKKAGLDDSDEDLEATLEEFKRKWEQEHTVTEEAVAGPPSARSSATLTACAVRDDLYLIGGEYFDGSRVSVYADVYRYSTQRGEWKLLTCPKAPGPRSSHQVVATPGDNGKLWLFGGEFSSPNQSSFYHYKDLWCFDIESKTWENIETKTRPSGRSGHRMTVFKQYIFLFGGFQDTGVRTSYLDDLWVWDTLEFQWTKITPPAGAQWPTARSGFSWIPCAEGIILYGGFVKRYDEKKRPVGVALNDMWLLKLPLSDRGISWPDVKWEKRRKGSGHPPSLRSGASMTYWESKQVGLLFGGVVDEDLDEESLKSVFFNDLYAYHTQGAGRWAPLYLRKAKKAGKRRRAKQPAVQTASVESSDDDEPDDDDQESKPLPPEAALAAQLRAVRNPDDPESSRPSNRYGALLAVQRNMLYIYGGLIEAGDREYTLDDFYALNLDKLDMFECLKESTLASSVWHDSDSDSESDSQDEESDEESQSQTPKRLHVADPEPAPEEEELVPGLGAVSLETRSKFVNLWQEDERASLPEPFESVRNYFNRSKDYWTDKALKRDRDLREKDLRREAFDLAREAFERYEPALKDLEQIHIDAGISKEDIRQPGARDTSLVGAASRNRR